MAPARAVFERISPSIGWRTDTDVMATTRPQPCSRMAGTAAVHIATVDSRFCSSAGPYWLEGGRPEAAGRWSAGVGHEDVDAAERGDRVLDEGRRRPPAVDTSAGMPMASPPTSVIVRTAASSFAVSRPHSADPRALRRELLRRREAEPARRTRPPPLDAR